MSGLIFSIPYLLFISACILLVLMELHYRKRPQVCSLIRGACILLYLLFLGLRGYIGTDWYSYYRIFEEVPSLTQGGLGGYLSNTLLEPGFPVFIATIKTLWPNYHFFIFVCAGLQMTVIHLFLKRYVSLYALGFLVCMVMGGLTLCDLLRNSLGIILFLLSLKFLKERRALPYFALNGLGMFFHLSSFFYLPLYLFLHRRWPASILLLVFIIGNLLFWFRVEWIRPLIEWGAEGLGGRFSILHAQYLSSGWFDQRYGFSIGYLERIVTALLALGFYRKLLARRETNVLFLNAFVLYFACFFFLSEIREFSARFSLLFVFAYWVLFPELYEVLRVRFNRGFFLTCLLLYAWAKVIGTTSNVLYRYDNVLWGVECYERRTDTFERFYRHREP